VLTWTFHEKRDRLLAPNPGIDPIVDSLEVVPVKTKQVAVLLTVGSAGET
jgi:hypothetical protein